MMVKSAFLLTLIILEEQTEEFSTRFWSQLLSLLKTIVEQKQDNTNENLDLISFALQNLFIMSLMLIFA